jgi:hypothetical protein
MEALISQGICDEQSHRLRGNIQPSRAGRTCLGETVTRVAGTGVPDADYEAAAAELGDKEFQNETRISFRRRG